MLLHLSIDNYAIADHVDIEFDAGMTAVTGETGAGKSILLDALGLALGERVDAAAAVRPGAERADIHATFDIAAIPEASAWLEERDLLAGDECLLRRTISAEGRSRGYVNGRPTTQQDLRALGDLLIDIHSQHAHQWLLQRRHQTHLLDAFGDATELAAEVRRLAAEHQRQRERLEAQRQGHDDNEARRQLLDYQVQELDRLALAEDELGQLETEQRQLAGGEELLRCGQLALSLCKEGEINVASILQQALRALGDTDARPPALSEAEELLNSALIQVEEAARGLQHFADDFELDPQRLQEVEERLSAIYDIARKHRIQPQELGALHRQLSAELETLSGGDRALEQLQREVEALATRWRERAQALSKARRKAATRLTREVEQQLKALAMNGCRFQPTLTAREDDSPHPGGLERVEFLISTNPGSPPQPLNRIASGGELSRISLAIQVITARTAATPTLVFDEVDVGVGGATAEVVGHLLRELGQHSQVLCVTHQPQVASQAQHHLRVEKVTDSDSAHTRLYALDGKQKVEEIARMLGGIEITRQTRAHARELIGKRH